MRIKVFVVGGTIDKVYAETKGTYDLSFGEPAIVEISGERVRLNFEYNIERLFQKDSLDMTDKDRQIIKKACEKTPEKKILITHGTDRMVDTAKVLSEIPDKLIVLTGAAQPYRFRESDAEFNIGVAIGALNLLEKGVYITMNGRIHEWDKVKKIDSGLFVKK